MGWLRDRRVLAALAVAYGVALAVLVTCTRGLTPVANTLSAVGLTIPSFALIGLLVAPLGFGIAPAIVVITFYAALPILRNAVVGLAGVPDTVVESARGIGMSRLSTLLRVELPMAWPVILTGMRVSGQMVMGVAAIAALVLWTAVAIWAYAEERRRTAPLLIGDLAVACGLRGVEPLVETEGQPLGRVQPLHHHQQRQAHRVGGHRRTRCRRGGDARCSRLRKPSGPSGRGGHPA